MKAFIYILAFISFNAFAGVTVQDCLNDSALVGHNKTPVQPLPECVTLLKADSSVVSVTSSDNKWKAFGLGPMIYIENYDGIGNLVNRELLAGESPELVSVQKLFIDPVYKRLFIVQVKNAKTELMIQDLEFIGNVSPLKVMHSESFSGLTSIKFNNQDEIEFVNASGTFTVNADAESRSNLSTKKALVITPK